MKQKNIKVAYTSRSCGNSYTQVPKIQMEGRWLEELGFSIGSTIRPILSRPRTIPVDFIGHPPFLRNCIHYYII